MAEGFDVPSIGTILLARPTKSRAKYFQQLGRGLRIFPDKKDCIVLDQAGNVSRHGFVEDLTAKDFALKLSAEASKGEPPVKECPECQSLIYISIMECECGYKFPPPKKEKADGELIELRVKFPNEKDLPTKYQDYRIWKREAFQKRIAPGFAMVKFKEKYGATEWVPREVELGALFDGNPSTYQLEAFKKYLIRTGAKKEWDDKKIMLEWAKEMGDAKWAR